MPTERSWEIRGCRRPPGAHVEAEGCRAPAPPLGGSPPTSSHPPPLPSDLQDLKVVLFLVTKGFSQSHQRAGLARGGRSPGHWLFIYPRGRLLKGACLGPYWGAYFN